MVPHVGQVLDVLKLYMHEKNICGSRHGRTWVEQEPGVHTIAYIYHISNYTSRYNDNIPFSNVNISFMHANRYYNVSCVSFANKFE